MFEELIFDFLVSYIEVVKGDVRKSTYGIDFQREGTKIE